MKKIVFLFLVVISFSNLSAQVEDYSGRSNSSGDEVVFRGKASVINYLSRVSFSKGNLTLRFKPDGLYCNGRLLTGAIIVEDYDEVSAIISCHSPYDGVNHKFYIISKMLAKDLRTGDIYYIDE